MAKIEDLKVGQEVWVKATFRGEACAAHSRTALIEIRRDKGDATFRPTDSITDIDPALLETAPPSQPAAKPAPVDLDKVKPSDRVTMEFRVERYAEKDGRIYVCAHNGKGFFHIHTSAIVSHTPALREIKKGDMVTWGIEGVTAEVIYLEGPNACVRYTSYNKPKICIKSVEDLIFQG